MCGRFAVTTDPAALAEKIQAINEARSAESASGPNYNVAPTTTITTVVRRHDEPDDEPTRRVRLMRWGLVPPWVKAGSDGAPESKGPQLINARADKITTSPAFRSSAKSKRCLVPMDGYYEWRANPDTEAGKKARKTPFYLHRADGEMLFMAGLWSVWKPAKDAAPLLSCTIITTVVRRHDEPDDEPTRRVRSMRWGLIPPWAKAGSDGAPESKGPLLINARAEKVTTSPAFRASAKSKRCLIPMDGYYEWRANGDTDSGKKARKTPFFLHRADGEMLFMAGLWSVWKSAKDATPLLSCTIITTDAVGGLAEIHDRMPLIVPESDWDRWLDPDALPDPDFLAAPSSVDGIEMREISTLVNSVRNNGPELLEPVEQQPEQATLL